MLHLRTKIMDKKYTITVWSYCMLKVNLCIWIPPFSVIVSKIFHFMYFKYLTSTEIQIHIHTHTLFPKHLKYSDQKISLVNQNSLEIYIIKYNITLLDYQSILKKVRPPVSTEIVCISFFYLLFLFFSINLGIWRSVNK